MCYQQRQFRRWYASRINESRFEHHKLVDTQQDYNGMSEVDQLAHFGAVPLVTMSFCALIIRVHQPLYFRFGTWACGLRFTVGLNEMFAQRVARIKTVVVAASWVGPWELWFVYRIGGNYGWRWVSVMWSREPGQETTKPYQCQLLS